MENKTTNAAKFIRAARKKEGLSQRAFGLAHGNYTRDQIKNWELGRARAFGEIVLKLAYENPELVRIICG
ncbi:MAG: helix-turn-helix transcriptional regulator [Desulfosarcina sp.]|nr:helix-turn-helix transcriptional regulator [Desulfosarcina sp.]MBC2764488.1 helix-turn-helix transcriptional regulator [Desulfosarcina sp.]